ncbi:MAG: hypothetical protein HC932_06245 [Thermales bacterium]|nr:hypothetical protein [Thermales bacterium]
MKVFKKIRKNLLYYSLLLVLTSLTFIVHKNWLFSFQPLIAGDWAYFYKDQLSSWDIIHNIWISYESLGRPITQINQIPLFSIFTFFSKLGFNYELISRLLFFYPIAILGPIFSYIFLYRLSNDRVGSLFGVILYNFNSYYLIIKGGHMHLAMAFTLAPLVYFFFLSKKHTENILGLLTAFVISVYEIRMAPLILSFAFAINVYFNYKNPIIYSILSKDYFFKHSFYFPKYILVNYIYFIWKIQSTDSSLQSSSSKLGIINKFYINSSSVLAK